MARTVRVEFPDGVRDVEPEAWSIKDGRPPRPVFRDSPYRIVETIDGRYIAVKDSQS